MAGTITVDKIQSDTSYNSTVNVVSALVVSNTATFANTTTHTGAATFANTTTHTGAATFANTLGVTGATTLSSTLAAGNTTITGTLATSGAATFANISSSGIITSVHPSFYATSVSVITNATGGVPWSPVVCGSEVYDIGSNYNAATGTFTESTTTFSPTR
jgi:hypothetical protein